MNQVEPLRLKEQALSGKPFCDRLGGSLLGFEMDTKVCVKCWEEKPVTEFHKNRRCGDGLHYYCKDCANAHAREYRLLNPEKIRAYRQEHREVLIAKSRISYQEHREKRIAESREYHRTHKAEHSDYEKEYAKKHPERRKARRAVNYAIATGKLARPNECSNPMCNVKCKPHGHHWSYLSEHSLDVIWVCLSCHKRIHTTGQSESKIINWDLLNNKIERK